MRYQRTKIYTLFVAIITCAGIFLCLGTRPKEKEETISERQETATDKELADADGNQEEAYTREEIDSAINVIKEEFEKRLQRLYLT